MADVRLILGDCVEQMAAMPEASVDSIVTDPPYELGFMGKTWDSTGIANNADMWRQALRVLKPGGHLLAFGGSRTYHRMACAIEDAGFEVRDQIMWIYGSGFPKSHNLDGQHVGWGTALKPAHEPIAVARKPFKGSVAGNVAAYGVGALNIDSCRVGTTDDTQRVSNGGMRGGNFDSGRSAPGPLGGGHALGRWPANVIHDGSDQVVASFPAAPGQIADASTSETPRAGKNTYGEMSRYRGWEESAHSPNNGDVGFKMKPGARRLDAGSAARFFYCAKASRLDRNEGLAAGNEPAVSTDATMREREHADWPARNGNHHPTVKPTELMRYLCRLVTPSGGQVLDPFMGSGSTGKAAVLEGFHFTGIEREADYLAIAQARIAAAQQQPCLANAQATLFDTEAP